jgi:hypothetical protein
LEDKFPCSKELLCSFNVENFSLTSAGVMLQGQPHVKEMGKFLAGKSTFARFGTFHLRWNAYIGIVKRRLAHPAIEKNQADS